VINDSNPYHRIIWSADVDDDETLLSKLEQIGQDIWVKLDRLYVRRNGDKIFGALNARGISVFNDAKLIEIPSKLEELARLEIRRTRPSMLNCMAGVISNGASEAEKRDELDGLKRFAQACLENDVAPCAVTVLTSKSEAIASAEFGRSPIDQVLWYASWLVDFGFTDIVCSPQEAEAIRLEPRLAGLDINTPGIRPPDSPVDDQGRTATPAEAIRRGVKRLVVGRPITNAGDPRDVVDAIAESIAPLI
jgi:orotidine-5'-phosphate decarboxylase